MYPRPIRWFAALLVFSALLAISSSQARPPITDETAGTAPLRHAVEPSDTFLLASFDFEGPGDTPDPQGWTSHDLTEQPAFFHIDDFAGMSPPYAPLRGAKSLWCGVRNDVVYCSYSMAPGYGNSWMQYFESVGFSAAGEVRIDFLARWDVEPGYDFVWVEYLSKTGTWNGGGFGIALNQTGSGLVSTTVPEDSLAGTAKLRLVMYSDGAFSDEEGLFPTDGAIEVDSLTVWDDNGVIDYQDFEAEAVGATATADGDWYAYAPPAFGDYAGLFDGDNIVQDDSLTFNDTHVWGFFNNSPFDMTCLGYPGQLVPPTAPPTGPGFRSQVGAFRNVVKSPPIDVRTGANGQPVPWDGQQLMIAFDLYADKQVAPSHVDGRMQAEYLIDGCWKPARGNSTIQGIIYDPTPAWLRLRGTATIPNGTTHVRAVFHVTEFNHSTVSSTHCHNVFPLVDNVDVSVVTFYATDAAPPAAAMRLQQNIPNPFNPVTSIGYTLERAGHVTLRVYDVSGGLVRTLVDREQRPDAGPFRVEWDGRADDGAAVSSGVYFYRLQAAGTTETRKMVLLK
jgi:hypothetical protein